MRTDLIGIVMIGLATLLFRLEQEPWEFIAYLVATLGLTLATTAFIQDVRRRGDGR